MSTDRLNSQLTCFLVFFVKSARVSDEKWFLHQSHHMWGRGFHTLRGRIDSGDVRFHLRVVGVLDERKGFWSGDGPYRSRVQRDLDVVPRGNFSRVLAP